MNIQNIYILDADPVQSAKYYTDWTVSAVLPEVVQILSDAHIFWDGQDKAYANVPGLQRGSLAGMNNKWRMWTRGCSGNYTWMHMFAEEILEQFAARYGRRHANDGTVLSLYKIPDRISKKEREAFPGKQYGQSDDDYVAGQRWLYFTTCRHRAQWSPPAEQPQWWNECKQVVAI